MHEDLFLPGIAVEHVLRRIDAAAGKELESGKLRSSESSSALAVNAFGWFIDRPGLLPNLPGTDDAGPAIAVDVEFCARFPWSGGRHPWLDAVVHTDTWLIGVESKRFEPFRDTKKVSFQIAYDRPVWGENMRRFEAMRDALRSGQISFVHLDAVQLVKHAFGLVTEGRRRGKTPTLFYLFAEPAMRGDRPIAAADLGRHRVEIAQFGAWVAGDAVQFKAASYREWIAAWNGDEAVAGHGRALLERFSP